MHQPVQWLRFINGRSVRCINSWILLHRLNLNFDIWTAAALRDWRLWRTTHLKRSLSLFQGQLCISWDREQQTCRRKLKAKRWTEFRTRNSFWIPFNSRNFLFFFRWIQVVKAKHELWVWINLLILHNYQTWPISDWLYNPWPAAAAAIFTFCFTFEQLCSWRLVLYND